VGAALETARDSISASELHEYVEDLADDIFEGREAGSRGGRAAAALIRQQLAELGLAPAGSDGDYYQPFGSGYRNIIAKLEGSDPELKNQYILLGAHYDHVGYGAPSNSYGPFGYIHNGADDNASGIASLLEVAEALTQLETPPKRSIVIAFWDAEEKGLLGSEHWIDRPTVPRGSLRFAMNADMVGRLRDNRLEVYGVRTGRGIRRLLAGYNANTGLRLDFTWELKPNSDHWTFLSHNVPVVMFHTGLHDNYHRPSDDAHLVNDAGMQTVARFMFHTVVGLADVPSLPTFRREGRGETEGTRRNLERRSAPSPPRLGVTWAAESERAQASDEGVVITQVRGGSPADRARLRRGDRIIRLAGQPTPDGDALLAATLAAPAEPALIVFHRAGESEPLERTLSLAGGPVRVGISWRADPAEPEMMLITSVVPGSPAARAGLAALDRIYAVNGVDVASSDQLRDALLDGPSPVTLNVERHGQLRTVQVEPLPQATPSAEPDESPPSGE
jgi:hypothetical protein